MKPGLEVRLLLGNRGGDIGEIRHRGGGDQARGGRHQGAGLARHSEGGRHFRDALLVDSILGASHLVEGEPGHQARRQGDGHSPANADIELHSEPDSPFAQPLQPIHRQLALALQNVGSDQAGQTTQEGNKKSALEQPLQQSGAGDPKRFQGVGSGRVGIRLRFPGEESGLQQASQPVDHG